MNKFLSTILASTLLLGAVGTSFALETAETMQTTEILQEIHTETLSSGTCGDNATYSFDSATGALTISGTRDMKDYSYSSSYAPWYSYGDDIKTVMISEGITSIGSYAFRDCTSLTSVTIPDSVTEIGYGAFRDCTSLTSVTIPDSVIRIGHSSFYGCTSLTSVTIPDSVTSIEVCAFNHCTSLLNIFVSESHPRYTSVDGVLFDKNLTLLVGYPAGKNVTSYEIPDSVTSIGEYAFGYCTTLTSVTIPDSVTSIGDAAFSNCTSLTSVTIGNSVTSIEWYAFGYCTSLTSVTIPDSVTSIGMSAFWQCTSLTSVTIPVSVSEISYGTFSDCTSLITVYYGGSEADRGQIEIDNDNNHNDPLLNATWIYNSTMSSVDPEPEVEEVEEEDTTPATPLPVATLYTSYLTNISGTSITSGSLPSGLGMLSNGTLGGIPTQQGDFDFYIGDSRHSLHIQENTPENVEADNDFEIIQRVPTVTDNFEEYVFEVSGEFPNFMNFYLDGRLLVRDVDYYAEEGSTRITLYAWTIGQLPAGMHTINATFTYGSGNNIEVQKVSQSFSKTSYAAAPSDYADYVSPTISANSGNSTSDTASYVAMNFSDVSVSDWFYTQVEYMYKTKTFSGTTATTYSPNDTMTRAMMAVVLYAFAEKPETTSSNISDVLLSDWYGNAVHWMGNQNIVTNSGDFRPNDPITREETAVMMYNFCKNQNISLPSVSSSEPKDFDSISASGKIAVETLFQQGIFGGDENGNFNPSKTATRAEISTIMKNFMVFSA